MIKITKRTVEALKPRPKDYVIWDSGLKGFGVRIKPTGVKTYLIQYRNEEGLSRRLSLGKHGPLTAEQARSLAKQRLGQVETGADPAAEKKTIRRAPLVKDLAERYMEEHSRPKKKPSSVEADERLLRLHILPTLGRRRVGSLTPEDIGRLHHSLRATPFQANRAIALLSKMLNLAERWGLRTYGSNPCRHIERFREPKRERFLGRDEVRRLGEALAEAESKGEEAPSAILAIRLLLLTGARKSEILKLRWSEVDFDRRCLRLSDSKTGEKTIPLSAPALELLATAPRLDANPYVCAGDREGGHLVGLHRPWARLQARAGLEGVRLHDLRHTFASFGAGSGLGLPIIGALLGHRQAATTHRYAHLAADPLHEAADRIAGEIAANLGGHNAEIRSFEERR